MAFKDEIISSIQSVADAHGNAEVIENLGTNGKAWNPDPDDSTKYQSTEIIITGLADAVIARTINRFLPYNGALTKVITDFISPNTIIMEDTNGLMLNDTFGVVGSLYNNGGKTVVSTSGNAVTVLQEIYTETDVSIIVITGPLEENINIEETIDRIQACIGDYITKPAITTREGLIKMGASVNNISSPSTTEENKLNELLTSLKAVGIVNT